MTGEKGFFVPGEVSFDYQRDRGDPGTFPFARGLHPEGYRTRKPTIRQFAGLGLAPDTNQRFKMLLRAGGTGLSTAFDLPTLMGRDSDDPLSQGQVGWDGVAVDTLKDMEDLFDEIPIDQITVSMTINAPAAIFLAMYVALANKRSIPLEKLGGTMQADILKEYVAQKEWRFPIVRGLDLVTDMIEYATKFMPRWNPISISGYHIREAGATSTEEVAYTLSNGVACVEEAMKRGMPLEEFAPRLSFFFDAHNRIFEEVAKLRAARILWARIMHGQFGAKKDSRACWCRMHLQTAGCTLSRIEPENNIARVAYQLLTAMLGGAQSIHANSFDEVLCTPTEEAVKIAIRTQQILQYETGICDYVDPLGGSYVIERLTQEIVNDAGVEISRINDMGGMVVAIEQGYPQTKIRTSAFAQEEAYERGEILRVGENIFGKDAKAPEPKNVVVELEKRRGYEEHQLLRLKTVRASRDEHAVGAALSAVGVAARRREGGSQLNMMHALINAASVYATVGEMMNVMEHAWGKYMEREIFSPRTEQKLPREAIEKYHLVYPMRILLAKAGLDGHDRPIYTLAELFKDLGAEVILPGLHCSAEDIAKRALEEDVDVVGISTHIGAPVVLLENIQKKLREVGKGDVLLLGGGIIRDHEREALGALGIEHFFAGDVSHENIAQVLFKESKRRMRSARRNRTKITERQRLSRLITCVSKNPKLLPRYLSAGNLPNKSAHVVGITGSAAAGKSTLIDKLLIQLRKDGLSIVVLAIDPTEELSGGAILGDVIRMRQHYADPGIFLRSLGSRGASSSVTRYLKESIAVARRFADVIIVETVGAGQADSELKSYVDTFVSLPDSRGDMVNLIKSGHHRHADILVVNMRTASSEEKNFAALLKNFVEEKGGWTSPIFSVNAETGTGVLELVRDGLYAHKKFLGILGGK